MLADSLPTGPRQQAVAKAEVEVIVAEDKLNLAIDNRDWADATAALHELNKAREERDRLLSVWILNIPGAAEWYRAKELSAGDSG